MRTYFLILALALLKVSMARPSGDDDFSIDMYQGDNHLRYERSNDEPTSEKGTIVTVNENIDADSENHETQTDYSKEPLSVQESIQRLADVSTEWEAKTSEEQKNEVEAHNVFQETVTTKDSSVESAATVKKEETPAVAAATAEVKEKKVEKAKEAAETSAHMSSKSTSKTEISTGSERRGGQPKEEAVELSRPRYLFQYGDVLNRINQDKVSPLAASKSQSKSAKSKKLSKASGPTKSVSYMMVNGKEYSGVSPNNMFLAKPQENAFNGPAAAAPYGGPRAFGGAAPVLPPGFNYAGFAPPSAQFAPAPVHGFGETHNLKSNLKMGFRGFGGQQRGGVQMLNFRQQPAAPFQAAPRFRPF